MAISSMITKMKRNGIPVPAWMETAEPIAARTFRSRFPFRVWVEPLAGGRFPIASTPGTVDVPENLIWWLEPEQSSDYDMLMICEELIRQRAPGLTLVDSPVSDVGVLQLRPVNHLRRLHLRRCEELSQDCLACLENKPLLHSLTLADCDWLIDGDLGWLTQLPALSELNLVSCGELSSEGLLELAKSETLSTLFLSWSPQLQQGIERLKTIRPDIQVIASGSPAERQRRYARL